MRIRRCVIEGFADGFVERIAGAVYAGIPSLVDNVFFGGRLSSREQPVSASLDVVELKRSRRRFGLRFGRRGFFNRRLLPRE
ncbi:hypothetical protein [Mycolicibacterium sp.]|uniref:hypothetical protein n=1 Tax=Mycolicibacterium sp. TaxID=2320850 RepID=UPI0037C6FD9B